MNTIPKPEIVQRHLDPARYQEALSVTCEPLVGRILASRPLPPDVSLATWLDPQLSHLDNPESLIDLEKAATRILLAIEKNEIIGLETDHDCDGQTSHAVLLKAFTDVFGVPKERIQSYIGHRLEEGYGLSDPLVERILAANPRPDLIITADNGSSDEARIKRLLDAGIETIVTDHHSLPQDGPPQSAFACVNPTRGDSQYPDPYIAGCMVAWLLMARTRSKLVENSRLPKNAPSMAQLLDFVAVGTVADCVSMSRSLNNRIVVRAGLKLLNQFKRPCWRALRDAVSSSITSEDLGFRIAPLLNSDGRLACAFSSVSFLLSETDAEALAWVHKLQETNQERKTIQNELTRLATITALKKNSSTTKSLSIFLEDGHAGVHGITASKIKDAFGKPTFIFSPKMNEPEILSGSGRSIDECHLRDALQRIDEMHPNVLVKFGGHRGAAGVTLLRSQFETFEKAFEEAVGFQISKTLGPVVYSDGTFPLECFAIEMVERMTACLEPFGREFDPPLFELEGSLQDIGWMGEKKNHMRFTLKNEKLISCVWFFARENEDQELELDEGDTVRILASIQVDSFRNQKRLKAMVRTVALVHELSRPALVL